MRTGFPATCTAFLLALAVQAVPLAAEAQPRGTVPRIGLVSERAAPDAFHAAFRQGLSELGYVEGSNIVLEYRYSHGVADRYPKLVAELVGLPVDVVLVGGTQAARAARSATSSLPIVFTSVGDPVGAGLAASLARPGGNLTGLSNVAAELSGKQLELLKAAMPTLSRVAVLSNPQARPAALDRAREAAGRLGVALQVVEIRQPNELEGAFKTLSARPPDAVLALSDPVFGNEGQLAKLAAAYRLPAMYARREFAEAGGLLAYGPSFADNYRRAASYVDRILKGAKPGDLPVEQPTRFELVVNLKTASSLGLTIPPTLLQRADQVIR